MNSSLQPTRLLALPAEVLLIILGELWHSPARNPGLVRRDPSLRPTVGTFRSIGGLRSISAVNRQLRVLCLLILFKITTCTGFDRFQQLCAKCKANPQFAGLIMQLDVVAVDAADVLHELLPFLTSLTWLDLSAHDLDTNLLALINSHPSLATVAVCDPRAALIDLVSSTDLPFSKILVSTTTFNRDSLKSDHALVHNQRGGKFSHIVLLDDSQFDKVDVSSLVLPGLEQLDLKYKRDRWTNHRLTPSPASQQSWLLNFAQRHTHLGTIKFTGWPLDVWKHSSGVPFAIPFVHAAREGGGYGIGLKSFSIVRPASWSTLKDWEVSHVELELIVANKISPALMMAIALAPKLFSLDIVLDAQCSWSMHIDEFEKAFSLVPSLRTLHLTNAYAHLHAGSGRSPWIHSQRTRFPRDRFGTSACVTALTALHWYMTRIVQQAPALEVIHSLDHGTDGRVRSVTQWTLQASFGVRQTEARELEVLETPRLEMALKYRPKS
ncbi:hypothetical protein MVEN_01033100 [Mycena venus]|uniref:Uncharacterized protein n=1 Tax=Mycena venus TaxID=2733690 RepID=A0A8H7D334_9AGAR|nr:hypothetical protein MVEN_01033100 [Mycena venus]